MGKKKKEKPKEVGFLSDKRTNEVKEIIIESCFYDGYPKDVLKSFEALLQDKYEEMSKEERSKILSQSMAVVGLDTHLPVAYAVKDEFRPLAIEFTSNLIKEYQCTTPSEKALAQIVGVSYVRVMTLSWQITSTLSLNKATPNLNQFLGRVSKDLDRAHRQFTSALSTLKNIKQPPIKVNLKANTAFIAQNQQLNSNQYENDNT